jgi:hypothetical protein
MEIDFLAKLMEPSGCFSVEYPGWLSIEYLAAVPVKDEGERWPSTSLKIDDIPAALQQATQVKRFVFGELPDREQVARRTEKERSLRTALPVAKTSEFATHECLSFVVKTSMIYRRLCGQVFTTEKRNPASRNPVVWASGRLRTCRYPTASESKPGSM